MSVLLGAASFAVGMLPLFFTFSKSALARLSVFGTGLLLGAALGIIIPEGIETLAAASLPSELPTSAVALSLLTGFTFMLVVEQLHSTHAHDTRVSQLPSSPSHVPKSSAVEFEVELGELESTEGIESQAARTTATTQPRDISGKTRAYPLTLGLVMHALADGLALGSSALSDTSSGSVASDSAAPSNLSLVVFFALAIHKAPTALALTTSLLSTSLSRKECKKHIAAFSVATPTGTLASYAFLSYLGGSGESRWAAVALLFSGGTFLYVATVLRPVSVYGQSEDLGDKTRILLIVLGMFVPYAVGVIVGHEHEYGRQ
ncbi:uncharacterized protein FIBRA_07659 [Fibroporia radiculosa]|uniref:Zinc/iron permease n=1 Tax=Fibroporia radiculosa TaxID=599839 RepID=J4GVE6_9APHY|nr:uncharacterized protein FIBRA_07659 [Fibroporia radiculosa]CCM05440.1 predicted protein [Fibroporia radiculosa]